VLHEISIQASDTKARLFSIANGFCYRSSYGQGVMIADDMSSNDIKGYPIVCTEMCAQTDLNGVGRFFAFL